MILIFIEFRTILPVIISYLMDIQFKFSTIHHKSSNLAHPDNEKLGSLKQPPPKHEIQFTAQQIFDYQINGIFFIIIH